MSLIGTTHGLPGDSVYGRFLRGHLQTEHLPVGSHLRDVQNSLVGPSGDLSGTHVMGSGMLGHYWDMFVLPGL